MVNKEVKISWEEFTKDIKTLAESLKAFESKRNLKFARIVCLTKGGLIPAYFIAKELDIAYIETLCIASYTDKKKGACMVIPESREIDTRKNWLIVDDLVDTGETLKLAKKYYPNSKVAVVYRKPESPTLLDLHTRLFDFFSAYKDGWIVFPWEK